MEKFIKERKEELVLNRKISRREKRRFVRETKSDIKKTRFSLRKLKRANFKFDKLKKILNLDLGIIRTRLKMANKQLRLLNKKEKELLEGKAKIDEYMKGNRGKVSEEKKVLKSFEKF